MAGQCSAAGSHGRVVASSVGAYFCALKSALSAESSLERDDGTLKVARGDGSLTLCLSSVRVCFGSPQRPFANCVASCIPGVTWEGDPFQDVDSVSFAIVNRLYYRKVPFIQDQRCKCGVQKMQSNPIFVTGWLNSCRAVYYGKPLGCDARFRIYALRVRMPSLC